MQNRPFKMSVDLTTVMTTNLLNPGTTTGGVGTGGPYNQRIIITHARVINRDVAPRTFSFWIGATGANAAGTAFMGQGKNVPINDSVDWYGRKPLDVADFLVGGASANTALTLELEGEIGLA
jgi:hypothetical protein